MEEQAIIPLGPYTSHSQNNVEVCPIFASPFLKGSCLKIDWLHAIDQGVGADFLGNFFYYVVRKLLEGADLTEKCSSLWMKIQAYYRRHEVQDRLQLLRFSMLRNEKASHKLRASVVEARALEMKYFRDMEVYEVVDRSDLDRTGGKLIDTR